MPKHGADCQCKHCERKRRFAPVRERQLQEDDGQSRFNARPIRNYGKSRGGSVYPLYVKPSRTPEENHWRESVLMRDGYKCVFCGATEQLQADHIKPQYLYPDLKLDVANGRTLCWPCHKKTDTYGSKVKKIVSVEVL